jgi:CDP-diacylglycerol--glycerol-3-phosphate 3-phosphatidyltransferase
MFQSVYNLPMILTMIRLGSPLVLPFLIFLLWPVDSVGVRIFLMIVFLLISLTDLLDGMLARYFNKTSKMGRLLDPIADKFLMISSLLALLAVDAVGFFWVIILVLREVFVAALRHIACEHAIRLDVMMYGKFKTWIHVVFIAYVLSPYGQCTTFMTELGYYVLLLGALCSSLYGAYYYFLLFLKGMTSKHDF